LVQSWMVVGSNAHIYSFPMNYVFLQRLQKHQISQLGKGIPTRGSRNFEGLPNVSIFGNLQMCTYTKWSNAISKVLIHVKYIMSRNWELGQGTIIYPFLTHLCKKWIFYEQDGVMLVHAKAPIAKNPTMKIKRTHSM
jgi:hypothetical protein